MSDKKVETLPEKRQETLPEKVGDLQKFILFGKEQLKAYEAKLRAMGKLDVAKSARDAVLINTQDLASVLLGAEKKLGELLDRTERAKGTAGTLKGKDVSGGFILELPEKKEPTLAEMGITKKESFYANKLFTHPDKIIEVIKTSLEKGKIPRREDVIRLINLEDKKEPGNKPPVIPGTFRTIVIDPPWPVEKILREERPKQKANLDYPTLTIDAIKKIKLPFATESHVYLWTTQKFLHEAFHIFEEWKVKYLQTLVWHKNVGFTPFGLFMSNAEFCLFGKKGSLELLKVGEKLCFDAAVREHSRKPDEFYDLIKLVSPEPRVDIFSREKHDGFEQWGNEIAKF